jgi:hypothetical protein
MTNLAVTYANQGKYKEAEALFKQCLDKRKVVLGENHPDTLDAMSNLERVTVTMSNLAKITSKITNSEL